MILSYCLITEVFLSNLTLPLRLLVTTVLPSADKLWKQFRSRSGQTECRSWSGSKLFHTLMVCMVEVFDKVDFENNRQKTKRHEKITQHAKIWVLTCSNFHPHFNPVLAFHDNCLLLFYLILDFDSIYCLYCKQYEPRLDCCLISGSLMLASMIKMRLKHILKICSRRKKQTIFSGHKTIGRMRVQGYCFFKISYMADISCESSAGTWFTWNV